MSDDEAREEALLIAEMQLLLAEKRTYYALVRTGPTVLMAAITIAAFLVATKELHTLFDQILVASVLLGGLALFAIVGLVIFLKAEQKIRLLTHLAGEIEKKNKRLAELIV